MIYLAGPDVFAPDPLLRSAELKALCRDHGAVGVFPLDADQPPCAESGETAAAISRANEALIARCDAVLANMTAFRGPSMDPGTAYEMGYAKALGKLVVGYNPDPRAYREKLEMLGVLTRSPDGLWRDERGWHCEDFGLHDNLMPVKGAAAVVASFRAGVMLIVEVFARTPRPAGRG